MASEVARASESLRRGLVFTPKVEAAVQRVSLRNRSKRFQ